MSVAELSKLAASSGFDVDTIRSLVSEGTCVREPDKVLWWPGELATFAVLALGQLRLAGFGNAHHGLTTGLVGDAVVFAGRSHETTLSTVDAELAVLVPIDKLVALAPARDLMARIRPYRALLSCVAYSCSPSSFSPSFAGVLAGSPSVELAGEVDPSKAFLLDETTTLLSDEISYTLPAGTIVGAGSMFEVAEVSTLVLAREIPRCVIDGLPRDWVLGCLLGGEAAVALEAVETFGITRLYKAGDVVMCAGDEASFVGVLASGLLTVVTKQGYGYVSPPEAFGETGVLLKRARGADVIASRDSVVLALPQSLVGLLGPRLVNASLRQALGRVDRVSREARCRVVAVVGRGAAVVVQRLALVMHQHGQRAAVVDTVAEDQDLFELERRHCLVLLADERSIRQADTVVLLGQAHPPVRPDQRVIAVNSPSPSSLSVATELKLDLELVSHLERLLRFIVGRPVVVVLSGGGARAGAHCGVLRELRRRLPIDVVYGTSGGAFVGALYCKGLSDRAMLRALEFLRWAMVLLLPLSICWWPVKSFFTGDVQRAVCKALFGELECRELDTMFVATSTHIPSATQVVHHGAVADAVLCSGLLPLLQPREDGMVDGGVLDNTPVSLARADYPHGIIVGVEVVNSDASKESLAATLQSLLTLSSVKAGKKNRELSDLFLDSLSSDTSFLDAAVSLNGLVEAGASMVLRETAQVDALVEQLGRDKASFVHAAISEPPCHAGEGDGIDLGVAQFVGLLSWSMIATGVVAVGLVVYAYAYGV